MREHKMTAWDEGQVLIKAQDCLFECVYELGKTKPEWAATLECMALEIGSLFNAHGSHIFALRSKEAEHGQD